MLIDAMSTEDRQPAEDHQAIAWYVQVVGAEVGPLSTAELKSRVERGFVTRNTLIRRGSDGAWVRAERFKRLFEPRAKERATTTADVPSDEDGLPPPPPADIAAAAGFDHPSIGLAPHLDEASHSAASPTTKPTAATAAINPYAAIAAAIGKRKETTGRGRPRNYPVLQILRIAYLVITALILLLTFLWALAYPFMSTEPAGLRFLTAVLILLFGGAFAFLPLLLAELIKLALDVARDIKHVADNMSE